MKRYFSSILFIFGLIAACTSGTQQKEKIKDHIVLKPFSDTVRADTFKVSLNGADLKEMRINFSITTYDGKLIYHKALKATDLIENYKSTVDLKKERSQMDFIVNEYKLFLDDENFLEPAVTETEHADQYTPDKNFYEELRRSSLNGFKFRTGKENNIYIAWSEREKK